jgi:hypothetical protein
LAVCPALVAGGSRAAIPAHHQIRLAVGGESERAEMNLAPSLSLKNCRVCNDSFFPSRPMQTVCGFNCAKKLPRLTRKTIEADRRATRAKIEQLRPLSYWTKQAQVAFNAWIRERDKHLPCISCNRFHAGKWNAGHYLSTGARPELRFDESNVHRQCEPCNTNLSGNLILYRVELISRIGQQAVDLLEGPQLAKRYRADGLKAIRDDYRARLKAMKA